MSPQHDPRQGEELEADRPREECGVLAIASGSDDVARSAFFGLYALQHRGQEAAGIAVSDGRAVRLHKGIGLVNRVFDPASLEPLVGGLAIGHTRYSTTGSNSERNVQPYVVETIHGPLAVAHNGNLVNADQLRTKLLERGAGLQSSSDSEVLALMLAGADGVDWEERLATVMPQWEGAFSLVILTSTKVIAARDPWGFRPLSFGRLPSGGHAIASETGALRTLGCETSREVEPGEVVVLQNVDRPLGQGHGPPKQPLARCTFEHIYFSRPDATWDGLLDPPGPPERLGEELAREHPVEADVVIPVPDSSIPAAIGYANASGIPYNEGFRQEPLHRPDLHRADRRPPPPGSGPQVQHPAEQHRRASGSWSIDDSIVRGTTSGQLIRHAPRRRGHRGPRADHLPAGGPPVLLRVDMGSYDELIAHQLGVPEIGDHIGADSLGFLSVPRMMKALGSGRRLLQRLLHRLTTRCRSNSASTRRTV